MDSRNGLYDDGLLMTALRPESRVDVLVVAAHSPHLRGLAETLGERFDGDVQGRRTSAKSVGIGPVSAAASTAKRVFALQPRAVIHIGTASAYSDADAFSPNDLVVPDRVLFADHGVIAQVSAFPEPMLTVAEATASLTSGLSSTGITTRNAAVASPASQTMTTDMAERIRQHSGAAVENLEAFAIRAACALAEVPYAAVLAVTEVVGPDRLQHRQQYERDATLASAQLVMQWLNTGAPGLTERQP